MRTSPMLKGPRASGVAGPIAFVNSNAFTTQAIGAGTFTMALPASRVNGNLLIAYFTVSNGATYTVGGGWTMVQNDSNVDFLVAYRYVDGTEAAPVFTPSTGNHAYAGFICQFQNTKATSPLTGRSTNSGSGTTASHAGITTTVNGSLVFAIITTNNNQVLGTPTGWTFEAHGNGSTPGSIESVEKPKATAGASGSLSLTITTITWRVTLYELLAA